MCYGTRVADSISVRDLKNTVSAVLRRVEAGERLTVTVDRRPVAAIVPLRQHRSVPLVDALAVATRHPADRALLRDVRVIFPDTTDDV
jgi:prevent-host-death family protein